MEREQKRKRAAQPTVADILRVGRSLWGKAGVLVNVVQPVQTEDRKFREFFGCGPLAALAAWNLLLETGHLPEKGTMEQYLWSLMCLKVYAKENVLCKIAGSVDPQTFRRWVWDEFVPAIAMLEPEVVQRSFICCSCHRFFES